MLIQSQYDVAVVGAGCAGLSAAIGLAKAGFSVVVLEAAVYPGAENWSGCVYFCESLAHPDLLGPEGVEGLAWERRLVQRGVYLTDGQAMLGQTYRDPEAFRHCYTVLRPIFDHHLAELARRHGVALLTSTTAEALIRDGGRVIGIATNRGPIYADVTFLAEGDASHLVTREGYERLPKQATQPHFLHGIKEVWELPPGAIEENFDLKPGEGAACEIILRNGKLNGSSVHLNMGGFIYTNRESLSIGLVLPADHLRHGFQGDPNLLIEWFEQLPDLQPWLRGGKRSVFGAKLIRAGGMRELPQLVDHGLAIGGAASGVGIDFPYPNYTGPATMMGLKFVQAMKALRRSRQASTREHLAERYLQALQQTKYWQDVEFLTDWPEYVARTQFFFDRQVDLALESARILTQPTVPEAARLDAWIDLVLAHGTGPAKAAIDDDFRLLNECLPLREVLERPNVFALMFHGALNALRGLFGSSATAQKSGELTWHYSRMGERGHVAPLPRRLARILERLRPGLAAVARELYRNDDTPLPRKLTQAMRILSRAAHAGTFWDATVLAAANFRKLWNVWWHGKAPGASDEKSARKPAPLPMVQHAPHNGAIRNGQLPHLPPVGQPPDLTPLVATALAKWEDRLGRLGYLTSPESHIRVHWPIKLDQPQAIVADGLWHVCPAHVYEARVSPLGQLQVVVNYENCIKCETCWRTTDLVDWGRDGAHRFVYAVHTPAVRRLLHTQDQPLANPSGLPKTVDPWDLLKRNVADELTRLAADARESLTAALRPMARVLTALDANLEAYTHQVAAEPRTTDTTRARQLAETAAYLAKLGEAVHGGLAALDWVRFSHLPHASATLKNLDVDLKRGLQEIVSQLQAKRAAWSAGTARRLRQHTLVGLRHVLGALQVEPSSSAVTWPADLATATTWRDRLEAAWGPYLWREIEQGEGMTPGQVAMLEALRDAMPAIEGDQSHQRYPAERAAILGELGRRDPSLAYRVAHHAVARDLLHNANLAVPESGWLAWVDGTGSEVHSGKITLERHLLPKADHYVLTSGSTITLISATQLGESLRATPSLGLRGAELQTLCLNSFAPLNMHATTPSATALNVHHLDLLAIALGMAEQLTLRCVGHALSRVQFPGLFHDERSRDAIGKFGSIKKMLAEMEARRLALETWLGFFIHHPTAAADANLVDLAKAVASEMLGTAPGSLSYNAGQIFGGTGYSEDDILSKYYRDAAAWRFLGRPSSEIWQELGSGNLPSLVPEEGETVGQMRQRGLLAPAVAQLAAAGGRLAAWQATDAADREHRGRFIAWHTTGRLLSLRAHAALEAADMDQRFRTGLAAFWAETERQWDRLEITMQSIPEPNISVNSADAVTTTYTDFLKQDLKAPAASVRALPVEDPQRRKAMAYQTGDFLIAPVDVATPRYLPDFVRTDPELASADRAFHATITAHFTPRGGQPYERYIEANHRPDEADLALCRQSGYFRFPIAKLLGGEGRRKADYYLLIMQANQFADATISLLIQANTSIGTTPILLAYDKDLPKARKDLAPFVADQELHSQVEQRLTASSVSDAVVADLETLLAPVLKNGTLKPLMAKVTETWKKLQKSAPDTRAAAAAAMLRAWQAAVSDAAEFHEELGRRLQACEVWLRFIAAGQISAFALTEPSAGSDTARVATRAKLCHVPVTRDADGVLQFTPEAGGPPRYLVDAARLEFLPEGVYYRYGAGDAKSPLCFDEYDYETDDPRKMRYYQHGSRRIDFTDIAFVRQRDGQLWYDYWEMNGAKMWITNGRVCGVMALYAKTPQGVTGFIVDRHAEGLVIGKDEAKLGQNGSPTNEVSLQNVRVPRENVLGLEGRGQVNALETLNVGRAGLAITSVSQIRSLVALVRDRLAAKPSALGQANLDRMETLQFLAESLAFKVIGLFEHKATLAVRIESAVSKMLVSELLHEVIELAEEVFGPEGQTREHLVEKRKRDARIINIYEGTNEVQRFLIVKELVGDVLPRWLDVEVPADQAQPYARELHERQTRIAEALRRAAGVFGEGLWKNPNLQPTVFHLAEGVSWFLAAEAAAGRDLWLRTRNERQPAGGRAVAEALRQLDLRLIWFLREWAGVERGEYAAVVPAADALYDAAAHPRECSVSAAHRVTRPFEVLVVLQPQPAGAPRPTIEEGRILEPYWALTLGDEAALELALELRDAAPAWVTITAIAIGPGAALSSLQQVAGRGVKVHWLDTLRNEVMPSTAARAIETILGKVGVRADLVLGGDAGRTPMDGMLLPALASLRGVDLAAAVTGFELDWTDTTRQIRLAVDSQGPAKVRDLPLAATILAGRKLRNWTTSVWMSAWPAGVVRHEVVASAAAALAWVRPVVEPSGKMVEAPRPLVPTHAAAFLKSAFGLAGDGAKNGPVVTFTPQPGATLPKSSSAPAVAWTWVANQEPLRPSAVAAIRAATHFDQAATVLLCSPEAEPREEVLAAAVAAGARNLWWLHLPAWAASEDGRGPAFQALWDQMNLTAPWIFGDVGTERAFAALGTRDDRRPWFPRVAYLGESTESLVLRMGGMGGTGQAEVCLSRSHTRGAWVTFTDEAEVAWAPSDPVGALGRLPVHVVAPTVTHVMNTARMEQLLAELKAATKAERLSEAEFILDVGYGVGNRDGFEMVIEPLEKALRELGVKGLMVGGSRKVTEELHLLPLDRQIGQSGESVNPRILLAIGVSGAPQHLNYIGPRATILAFNRDPEAPIMKLNQRQAEPRVFPVVGDLFQTVPAFVAALRRDEVETAASLRRAEVPAAAMPSTAR